LSSTPNPSNFGQTVIITATIGAGTCSGAPPAGGTVTFLADNTQIGQANVISGTATISISTLSVGTHPLTAQYSGDSNNSPASSNTVNQVVKAVVTTLTLTCNPATGPTTVGVFYATTCTASGGTTPYSFSNPSGLPAGLSVQTGANTLTITGTPTQAGPYNFVVTVQDASSPRQTATAPFSGTVNSVVTALILTCNPTTGPTTVGVSYTTTCTASGGTAPYSFVNPSGLPSGLSVQTGANTLTITGTPTQAGSYSFVVTVQDASSPRQTATAPFSGTVGSGLNLTCNPTAGPATVGVFYTTTCTASGGTAPYSFVNPSGLPAGLSVQTGANTLTIAGTPTQAGSYSFAVAVQDSSSPRQTATVPFSGTVGRAALITTQTALSANPTTAVFGQTVGFSASVSPVGAGGTPTGSVTLSDTNSNSSFTGTLTGGTASFSISTLSVGSHTLIASYSGDNAFNQSSSLPVNVQVNKAPTTTALVVTPTSSNLGATVQLTAKVTSSTGAGPITGTITFMDGNLPIGGPVTVSASAGATATTMSLASGPHSLTAVYSGDVNFAASTSPQVSESVGQTTTTTTLSLSSASTSFGQNVTLTAAVSAAGATGTVTFEDGGSPLVTQPLSNGGATFNTATLSPGIHSLSAVYNGDSKFGTSTGTATETVAKGSTTTALTASPSPGTSGQPVTLRAVVTPAGATGTVTFQEGNTTLGSSALNNGVATIAFTFPTGSHALTASYSGDVNYNPSSGAATEVVNPNNPLTNISPVTLLAAFVGNQYSVTFTATGGVPPLTWSMPSVSVPGLTINPQTGVLSGTPTTTGTTTLGVRVTDSLGSVAASAPSLTVLPQPPVSISVTQPNLLSDQPTPQVTITPSYPVTLVATFALSFKPDPLVKGLPATYTMNPDIKFPNGTTTSQAVTIPANSTAAFPIQPVQLGSLAGGVTVTLASLVIQSSGQPVPLPNPAPSQIITVKPTAPVITSVKIVPGIATSFQVVVDATATTRDLTTANLIFTAPSGAQLNGSQPAVPLSAAAAQWFVATGNASLAPGNGGSVSVTIPFTYAGDPGALPIDSVSVTLTTTGLPTSAAVVGK
jgi:hypothetical protein